MGSSDNFCLRWVKKIQISQKNGGIFTVFFLSRWNDFESNISTSFRELREDSEFFDVTLCCDNGTDVVQAHKVILAACSPLFRKILAHQKNQQNPFLYLKGIRLKELQAVLNFMYHGEVNVAQDALNNFLAVAEELAVKGLTTDGKSSTSDSNNDQRKKAVPAKRKSSALPAVSTPTPAPKKAKPAMADAPEVVDEDPVDVKRIKAEPEPSGSGANVPLEADLVGDDSYAGDEGDADFGEGEDFESFGQYGDGNDFDDSSLGAAGGSGTATDSKGRQHLFVFSSEPREAKHGL